MLQREPAALKHLHTLLVAADAVAATSAAEARWMHEPWAQRRLEELQDIERDRWLRARFTSLRARARYVLERGPRWRHR